MAYSSWLFTEEVSNKLHRTSGAIMSHVKEKLIYKHNYSYQPVSHYEHLRYVTELKSKTLEYIYFVTLFK